MDKDKKLEASRLPKKAWISAGSGQGQDGATSLIPRPQAKRSSRGTAVGPATDKRLSDIKCARPEQRSLSKSLSLNEIQNRNINLVDSTNSINLNEKIEMEQMKAVSLEQLSDEKSSVISTPSNMEVSVEESSTSLGLIPALLASSNGSPTSPFDFESSLRNFYKADANIGANCLHDFKPKDMSSPIGVVFSRFHASSNYNEMDFDEDAASEHDIPTIEDEESLDTMFASNQMMTDERPATPLVVTDALSDSYNNSHSLEVTESMDTVINLDHDMAMELGTMGSDNSRRIDDNEDAKLVGDKNIPLPNHSFASPNENLDIETQTTGKVLVSTENKPPNLDDSAKTSKIINSSVIRPNSLRTKPKTVLAAGGEKHQRPTTSESSTTAPLRKKIRPGIKTPGRWDLEAIANRKKEEKVNNPPKNIRSKIDTNLSSNRLFNPSNSASLAKKNISLDLKAETTSSQSSPTSLTAANNLLTDKSNRLLPTKRLTKISATKERTNLKPTVPKSNTFIRDSTNNTNNCGKGNGSSQQTQPNKKDSASAIEKKIATRKPTSTINSQNLNSLKKVQNSKSCSKKDKTFQQQNEKQQIQNLTDLCESKSNQLKTISSSYSHLSRAFDSLSIVTRHLVEQYNPFETPELRLALIEAENRCEEQKNQLVENNREFNEICKLNEDKIKKLSKEKENFIKELKATQIEYKIILEKTEEEHQKKLNFLRKENDKQIEYFRQVQESLEETINGKNEEIEEIKGHNLALQDKIGQLEENVLKDKKSKYLGERIKNLQSDVSSLNFVIDMRNEKIKTLEKELASVQDDIQELPVARETIKTLHQQIENLQATLDKKIAQYNKLTYDHQFLKEEYEKERIEKRRLSMRADEMEFRLSESFHDESMTNAFSTNFNSTSVHPFQSNIKPVITEDTPIKTAHSVVNRSHSKSFSRRSCALTSSSSNSDCNLSMSGKSRCMQMNRNACESPALFSHVTSRSSLGSSQSSQQKATSKKLAEPLNCKLSNGTCTLRSCSSSSIATDSQELSSDIFLDDIHDGSSEMSALKSVAKAEPHPCVFDSGFEDIQGLMSMPHK